MIAKQIQFQSCEKKFTDDLDKARRPEETLEIFYDRVKNLDLKIVREVKRIDTGRLDIPVFFSVYDDDGQLLTGSRKAMGKGASVAQAEASACMELTERFSFFAFKDTPDNFLTGGYRQMVKEGYPVIPLTALLQSVGDTTTSPELFERLIEDIPLRWARGTNVTRGEEVLIPFSWFFAINEYNGSSAGNTLEEAALQGICEVVERHVCAKVSLEQLLVAEIDPDSVQDPVARELLEKFSRNGITLRLSDFTLDTGIATVAAVAFDPNSFPEKSEIVYTAGTAPSAEKALIRTLTEVAQLGGDFETFSNYLASGLPKPQSLEDVAFLYNSKEPVAINTLADCSDSDIKVELDSCIEALANIGLEVFMIDVTHDGLKLPALYTIVPGTGFRERSQLADAGLFAARLALELIDDPDELAGTLEMMESLLPSTYYLPFYRGRDLYNNGDLQGALEYLQTARERKPLAEDMPFILSYLGLCLRDLGRYDEAVRVLEKGLDYDEQRPDIYNTLGVCFFKQDEYERAISCFKRAVELDPASAMDYANIGVNYHRLGKTSEAREFLTLALTLDSSLDFARELLAKL